MAKAINNKEYPLSVKFNIDDTEFKSGIKRTKKALNSFVDETEKASRKGEKLTNSVNNLGNKLKSINQTYKPTISLKDAGLKKGIQRVKQGLNSLQTNNKIVLKLRDQATERINKVKGQLSSITNKVHTARINIKQSGAIQNIKGKAGSLADGMLMGAGGQALGMLGVGLGVYKAFNTANQFEQGMKNFQSITGVVGDEFEAVRKKALEMGASTEFTAIQVTEAMRYMGMAGWNAQQTIDGIAGVMNLASASGEDLATVSDIVTDGLTAFGLQAKDTEHFVDVLAKTATSSNTSIGMMGETFKYVAPIAGALKYSTEDTALAIGLMANSGIKASQAGTSLKRMMTELASDSSDAGEVLKQFGIKTKDAQGNMIPFKRVLEELRSKFKNLSDSEKTAIAETMVGKEAMAGFLAVINASDADFNKLAEGLANCNGEAKKMADTRIDTLQGDILKLQSAWEGLILSFANSSGNNGLREFIQETTRLISNFSNAVTDESVGPIKGFMFLIRDLVGDLIGMVRRMDGIGSIIAGGTLLLGLKKIAKLLNKAKSGLKELTTLKAVTTPPINNMASAREMVLNANSVYVNGRNINEAGAGNYNYPKSKRKVGRAKGIGRLAPIEDVPKAGLFNRIGNNVRGGALTGAKMAKGFFPLTLALGAMDIATSEEEKKGEAIGRTVGETAGVVIGGAIGGAIGSVIPILGTGAGATVGSLAGGFIGNWAGEKIGGAFSGSDTNSLGGIQNYYKQKQEIEEQSMETTRQNNLALVQWLGEKWNGLKDLYIANKMEEAQIHLNTANSMQEASNNALNSISGYVASTTNTITSAFLSALNIVKNAWSGFAEWFSGICSNVQNKVSSIISSASNVMSNTGRIVASSFGLNVNHNATGSSFYSGGLTTLNERGGEIVDLPNGSRIYPHQTTTKMLEKELSSNNGNNATVNVTGNTFIVRKDTDIDEIAHKIASHLINANLNYGGI